MPYYEAKLRYEDILPYVVEFRIYLSAMTKHQNSIPMFISCEAGFL